MAMAALALAACGGGGGDEAPANRAPQFSSAAQVSVPENSVDVYTAVASDPDGNSVTYSIASGGDGIRFLIDAASGALRFRSAPDFENPLDGQLDQPGYHDNDYLVEVVATDNLGKRATVLLTVTVTDVQEPPAIQESTNIDVNEGNALAADLVGTDPEGATLTWTLEGGADQSRFSLDSVTGELRFLAVPDFEAPADADTDNVYHVTVGLDDGITKVTSDLIVTVVEVNESPVITSSSTATVDENRELAYSLIASDPDEDTLRYRITGGDDRDAFRIGTLSGELTFVELPDFEAPVDQDGNNEYLVDLEVSDQRGLSVSLSLVLSVNDLGRDVHHDVPFPPDAAQFGGYVDDIQLVGRLRDYEGGSINSSDINSIYVEGSQVFPDSGDASRWHRVHAVVQEEDTAAIEVNMNSGTVADSAWLRNAPFFSSTAVAMDSVNNRALLAGETGTGKIVAVDLDTEERYLLTRCASLYDIHFLALNDAADGLVVAATPQSGSVAIWWLDLLNGTCQKVSGDGAGSGVSLGDMRDLTLDEGNNRVLTVDADTNAILSVDLSSGARQTLSGNGAGSGDAFDTLRALDIDADNNRAVVSSDGNVDKIFGVDLDTGERLLISDELHLGEPWAMTVSAPRDTVYLVSQGGTIRSLNLVTGVLDIATERGFEGEPRYLGYTRSLDVDEAGNRLLIATESGGAVPRFLYSDLETGTKKLVSNSGVGLGLPFRDLLFMTRDLANDRIWVGQKSALTGRTSIVEVEPETGNRDQQLQSGANGRALVYDAGGDRLLALAVADGDNPDVQIIDIDPSTYAWSVLAAFPDASTQDPRDMVLDEANNRLLYTDSAMDVLFAVDLDTGSRTVLSGFDPDAGSTVGGGAGLNDPGALALDSANGRVMLVDAVNGLVAVDLATGDRTDLMSPRSDMSNPDALYENIALDPNGGSPLVYGVDTGLVQVADPGAGTITDLVGPSGSEGPSMNDLRDIVLDERGDAALVADFTGTVFVVETATGQRAIMSR